MSWSRRVAVLGAGGLGAAAALHAAWATGSAWPARDRGELATTVAGTSRMPGPAACWAVSAALAGAAAVTAGAGGQRRTARFARTAVTVALLLRGVSGVTGRTGLLVPWTPSARFAELDRRVYGPVCCLLAGLAAAALPAHHGSPRS